MNMLTYCKIPTPNDSNVYSGHIMEFSNWMLIRNPIHNFVRNEVALLSDMIRSSANVHMEFPDQPSLRKAFSRF